jgi:hypothetical protein
VFRFHSRDLHMVLAPARQEQPVRFRVKLNSASPGDEHGSDSGAEGAGEVREPRMYQLIRQKGPVKDVDFEIEFLDPYPPSSHRLNQRFRSCTGPCFCFVMLWGLSL